MTTTSNAISACEVPQYSAHAPRKMPVRVGSSASRVHAAGNHVHLAAERRDPERVDDVATVQLELDRLADRQPDLVRELDLLPVRPEGSARATTTARRSPRSAGCPPAPARAARGTCEPVDQEARQHDRREDDAAAEDQPAVPSRVACVRRSDARNTPRARSRRARRQPRRRSSTRRATQSDQHPVLTARASTARRNIPPRSTPASSSNEGDGLRISMRQSATTAAAVPGS